jgi:hypothetical protein
VGLGAGGEQQPPLSTCCRSPALAAVWVTHDDEHMSVSQQSAQ